MPPPREFMFDLCFPETGWKAWRAAGAIVRAMARSFDAGDQQALAQLAPAFARLAAVGRERPPGDSLRRHDPQSGEQVGGCRDFEPRLRARLGALVAAREPPPPAQSRESVLDLVERTERRETVVPFGGALMSNVIPFSAARAARPR